MFTAIIPVVLLTAPGADPALEPWASKAQLGDVTKRHVEKIGTAEHKYTVVHGGTMDGTNCRSPMGCGMNREGAIEQTWQSNRAVRMENDRPAWSDHRAASTPLVAGVNRRTFHVDPRTSGRAAG